MKNMKIITWNVNSVGVRKERLAALLAREQPDMLCLQELKCVDEKFPQEVVEAAGYKATIFGQKTYNGVAVISKEAPDCVQRGFDDGDADDAARFIKTRFGDLTVMSAYIPNGQTVGSEKYDYKLRWLERLHRYLAKHFKPTDRLVLVGDFNIAPDDMDVYDPAAWMGNVLTSPAEREALKRVMSFGLDDTFRRLHPDTKAFSWWDYRMLAFPKNQGLRIDHVLTTPPMTALCRDVRIDRDERKGDKPSDHAPVIATFTL